MKGYKDVASTIFRGADNQSNFYVTYLDMWKNAPTNSIIANQIISKISSKGKLMGIYQLPKHDARPTHWFKFNNEKSFVMLFNNKKANIYRITLGNELPPENFEEKLTSDTQTNSSQDETFSIQASSISRNEVYNRGKDCIYYDWTYQSKNADNPDPSNVTQPDYLGDVSYGTGMTGIPYCWGGFDGTDKSSDPYTWNNFGDAMNQGIFAGNVYCYGGYESGTAGLDCSGYVSAAADYDSKKNTTMLASTDYSTAKDVSNREQMDIFIKSGSHVLFYHSDWENDLGIYSMEATTSGEDKTKFYDRSWDWLNSRGYELRELNVIY